MKNLPLIAFLSFFLASFTYLAEIKNLNYQVDDSSTITISGTSNIHDWIANVNTINGNVEFSQSDDGLINIDNCKIKIDAKSIKSTKGSTMDKKIYKALKTDSYSSIDYIFNGINNINKTSTGFTANVGGELSIAGTKKTISLDIIGKELANGGYEITGNKDLKMTSFNVDPPTAMFGALTTGDDITLEFRVLLNLK